MYTQCPECQIAFRVTAKVLQQAQGNVRCGSCGHAFNALSYLSEDMPAADSDAGDAPPRDDLAETSRRLLETLDELAGPDDVVIEDTGVEWRVLGEVAAGMPESERRYDDNSPLPDEYDDDLPYTPPSPRRREDDVPAPSPEFEDRQQDLALSEPEDWTDILEEVTDDDVDSFAVEEELIAIHNELATVDDGAALTDEPFEETPDEPAMEIRLSEEVMTDEVPELDDVDFGEAIEDDVILIGEDEAAAIEVDIELLPDDAEPLIDDDADTGVFSVVDDEEEPEDEQEDAPAGDFDGDAAAEGVEFVEFAPDEAPFIPDIDDEPTEATDDELEAASGEEALEALDDEPVEASEEETAEPSDEEEGGDAESYDSVPDFEEVFGDDDRDAPPVAAEPVVPEPTEEEKTVNMEIDEQLMNAIREDDPFAATFVGVENPADLFDENADGVETIIMEGEFIRNAVEKERVDAESAARSQLDDPARLADTYALSRQKLRGGRRKYDPPPAGILAAVIALALLLIGQYVHNSRETLATYGFFQNTIAPIYRVFGSPVTPEWDIKGWQFEATSGSVNEDESQLTIVSRIINRSEQPLPYPLIHVSLTNRYEDVMGSRILEPAAYLGDGLDPSELVPPGTNFNAVIVIEQPSPDATGFKLNVCYRVEAGIVRCAIEDFK